MEKCNLRCGYCMFEDGVDLMVKDELFIVDEIGRVVKIFVVVGVDKVWFIGGELMLRKDLEDVVRRVSGTSGVRETSVTMNGVMFVKWLDVFRVNGLMCLNVLFDMFVLVKFEFMMWRKGYDWVLASVDKACEFGF